MKFHPLNISIVKSIKEDKSGTPDLVYCQSEQEMEQQQNLCALISFRPKISFNKETTILHTGDIFYVERTNEFFVFSLYKREMYDKAITKFGFFLLEQKAKPMERKELSLSTFFEFDKMMTYLSQYEVAYVGNIYLHDLSSFLEEKDEQLKADDLYKNATTVNHALYHHNQVFLISYVKEDIEYIDWFDQLTMANLLEISQSEWNVYISSQPTVLSVGHPAISTFNEDHRFKYFVEKTGSLCMGTDLYSEKLFTQAVQSSSYYSPEKTQNLLESISYYKEFFVTLGEDGVMGAMSLRKTESDEKLAFLISPLSSAYQILTMSNNNDAYLQRYIEILE